jgi:hypothetical protein
MTIAIAVCVSEGLVFAADSRTTRWMQSEEGKWLDVATDRARKVFALSRKAGAVTHGRSQINRQTIASLADRFRCGRPADAPEDITVVLEEFTAFLRRAEEPAAKDASGDRPQDESTGFLIGGYGADGIGRLYELRLPGGEHQVLSTTEAPNYHWRGQGDAVARLMKGIDPRLDRAGLPAEAQEALTRLEYSVKLRNMSIEDAVEFAHLLGQVAMGIDHFTAGMLSGPARYPLVGGRLSTAVVTPDGFKWVNPPPVL